MADDKKEVIKGLIDVPKDQVILLMEAGYYLNSARQFEAAFEIFNGLAFLAPHSEVPLMALGNLYLSQNNYRRAQKEQEAATKKNPESAAAFAQLGEILMIQKKYDEGIVALDKAIELDPKGPAADFAKSIKKGHELKIFDN